ncbi:complement C1q tumor necrosis factor-related protein 3-like [Mercenaria mercenaria]|uniref:complement C1q tumor necrosis factor-related protein 3-like n=1 Tax=Mercenaria mercenaria TaxID=6596 RepID=UPI00234E4AB8|nr:complement C1q tumor necrosis factor-related protein 3-like [Mercenaria mercenaria]
MFTWEKVLGKYYLALYVVILFLINKGICNLENFEPGQCLSKFDYDYNVMQKLWQFVRDIQELKQRDTCRDTRHVAFMAELSADLVNPSIGTTIVFDTVHTNVGDGYKPGPGIFVAPVNGTYNINLVASSSTKASSSALHLYIMHNEVQIGYVFLDYNSDKWLFRSTTAVVELIADDTVFVKVGYREGAGTVNGAGFHTHISGFLIN